jgi:hypothetical protein
MSTPPPKPPDTSFLRSLALVGQVGVVMVVAIGFGVTFGIFMDRRFEAGGTILIPMILGGVASGGYFAYRILAKEIP